MTDSVRDRVGQQLGNYRLLRLLRQESTTDVYLGEHIFLKTQASIQVLPEQLSSEALEAFLTRTRLIARLKHPHILRILEFGVEGKMPFLVTDYTPNASLRQRHPRGTQVSPSEIASYVTHVTSALQYIHDQGLIHGRVRPENMLPGPQQRLLLGDFNPTLGIASEISAKNTPQAEAEQIDEMKYMAPEQLLGRHEPASDQYALGIVIYEWLSGDTPFHGSASEIQEQQHSQAPAPLSALIPTISPELKQVVMTALAKDPRQRFANVAAFAHALKQILPPVLPHDDTLRNNTQQSMRRSELPTEALPTLTSIQPQRQAPKLIGISLILIVLLVIGGSFLYNTRISSSAKPLKASTITASEATQTALAKNAQQAEATFTSQDLSGLYTNATRGTPIINDPLNHKSTSIWQSNNYCLFSKGTYHVQAKSGSFFPSLPHTKSIFRNFVYEVQMQIVKGTSGGVVFRSNSSWSNFYTFTLPADTTNTLCTLALYKKDTSTDLETCTLPSNLQSFNLITVIAYVHTFYFYINKSLLMKVQDSTLETGAIGMYTLSSKNDTADVVFRNAKIWQL